LEDQTPRKNQFGDGKMGPLCEYPSALFSKITLIMLIFTHREYAAWDTDQPDGDTRENCLEMRQMSGLWNDISCDVAQSVKGFVCSYQNSKFIIFTCLYLLD